MRATEFWRVVVADHSAALDRLLELLEANRIPFCIIGGQGVNAYVEPLVSLDLDLVIATEKVEEAVRALSAEFEVRRFPHTINLGHQGSDLRIQIQTDPRYSDFVARSAEKPVLGIKMPVADLRDILRSKIWAAMDENRRASKRQKDLADIGRILEAYPDLRSEVPEELLSRLF